MISRSEIINFCHWLTKLEKDDIEFLLEQWRSDRVSISHQNSMIIRKVQKQITPESKRKGLEFRYQNIVRELEEKYDDLTTDQYNAMIEEMNNIEQKLSYYERST